MRACVQIRTPTPKPHTDKIHTYACIHKCTNIRGQARTYTDMHYDIDVQRRTQTRADLHTYTDVHVRTQTCAVLGTTGVRSANATFLPWRRDPNGTKCSSDQRNMPKDWLPSGSRGKIGPRQCDSTDGQGGLKFSQHSLPCTPTSSLGPPNPSLSTRANSTCELA